MAQDGLARAIYPVHTPLDGDIVFAAATGRRPLADPLARPGRARHRRRQCGGARDRARASSRPRRCPFRRAPRRAGSDRFAYRELPSNPMPLRERFLTCTRIAFLSVAIRSDCRRKHGVGSDAFCSRSLRACHRGLRGRFRRRAGATGDHAGGGLGARRSPSRSRPPSPLRAKPARRRPLVTTAAATPPHAAAAPQPLAAGRAAGRIRHGASRRHGPGRARRSAGARPAAAPAAAPAPAPARRARAGQLPAAIRTRSASPARSRSTPPAAPASASSTSSSTTSCARRGRADLRRRPVAAQHAGGAQGARRQLHQGDLLPDRQARDLASGNPQAGGRRRPHHRQPHLVAQGSVASCRRRTPRTRSRRASAPCAWALGAPGRAVLPLPGAAPSARDGHLSGRAQHRDLLDRHRLVRLQDPQARAGDRSR